MQLFILALLGVGGFFAYNKFFAKQIIQIRQNGQTFYDTTQGQWNMPLVLIYSDGTQLARPDKDVEYVTGARTDNITTAMWRSYIAQDYNIPETSVQLY